jgi:putative intracellular protease/amidase
MTKSRYLPEAAHPYYVVKKNGFDVVFASPKGKHNGMTVWLTIAQVARLHLIQSQ